MTVGVVSAHLLTFRGQRSKKESGSGGRSDPEERRERAGIMDE